MDRSGKIILVTGGTGQQGGAVARQLIKENWKVRVLTRDIKKPAAVELKELGAELFQGNMNDIESLDNAMNEVYGVFSVQNFWEHGYEGELTQGKNTADAAKKAGVKHFLQSSVGGAERNTNLPHFEVKFEIEQYVKTLNIPVTILRPVFFMENFGTFNKPVEDNGKLTITIAMKKDTKLQMITVNDIGALAAIIFNQPEKYIGKEIEAAGDDLTISQVAEIYSKVSGKETVFNELPIEVLRSDSEEFANMFQWFIDKGYESDIEEMKNIYPGMTSFEDWFKNNYKK